MTTEAAVPSIVADSTTSDGALDHGLDIALLNTRLWIPQHQSIEVDSALLVRSDAFRDWNTTDKQVLDLFGITAELDGLLLSNCVFKLVDALASV